VNFIKKLYRILKTKALYKKMPAMIYQFKLHGKSIPYTRVGSSTVLIGTEKLTLSQHVFIGHFNFIEASNGIVIHEGVQITNYCSIISHSSHKSIRLYGYEYAKVSNPLGYVKGSVEIGAFTFIGPHSTIMPSTKIGKGSIVSAYSFVKGDFPDFSVISGNPAKVIGDTRTMDQKYLDEFPELQKTYTAWAKEEK
jgi:acetyltransferase-like isoleucine patch superfamily enzyme